MVRVHGRMEARRRPPRGIRLTSLARVEGLAMDVKKAEGRVTAVLFDVDGTLVDTNYLHAVTW